MAKIHILAGSQGNIYTAVVHAPTPAGNNAAGISWATALANSGRAVSSMPVGNGAGQISQSESNQIAAGSVMEGQFVWQDNPEWTNAERIADLDLRAAQLIAALTERYGSELRLFGFSRS